MKFNAFTQCFAAFTACDEVERRGLDMPFGVY